MKDIRQKKKRTWEDIGDPTRRRAAKSAYEAEQSQYQETPTTGETPPTPPILQEPTGPDERGSEQAELEVEVEEAPTAEGQYESEYAAYLENLNEYGIPGAMERAEEAQAEAVAETRGYDATYWQDPKHVAHWYNAIQSKPPDAVLPEWMTPELQQNIKDAYEFMSFRNGDVPWTEWKYLNANDQALPLLAALPDPPEDFMWPEERGQYGGGTETSSSVSIEQVMSGEAAWSQIPEAERTAILHDPQFDIAAFDPMVRQQILSDPNFNWDGLPPWQKMLFNLQSNPIIGGVVQGMMFGGGSIKGAVLGGVVGKAAEVTGYNPNKWFYEQGNGEPGIQAGEVGSTLMGLLNDLGQLMEVGFGYAGQVLDPLLGGRPDVAMELLTDPVQREAALRASRVAYESSPIATFATNIIKGVSPMFSEEFGKKREALKEQYNNGEITYGEFLKGYGDAWEELSGPWLKPGEQIMMGKSEPVTIMPGVDPKLVWYQAMGQARKAIAAEIERGGDPQAMMESIIQDWSSYAGAPVADLFMQATADPLNAMPFVEGKIQSEIIKSTAGDKVPLFKGGWEEPSKVTAEWKAAVGQMDAAQVGELPAFTRWLAGYNKQGEIMAGMGPLKGLYPNETLTRTTPQEGMKGWAQRVMTLAPENRAKLAMSMAADHMGAIASHLTPAEFDNFFTSLQKMDLEAAKNIAGDVVGSAEFYTILPMLRGFDMNELKTGMWDVSAENRGHLLRLADVLGMEPGRLVEDLGKPDSAARVYEQLRQAAMRTNDSTGKALLEDMQAGRIRVEDLEQIGRAFNGPDAMPWHPAQFQAMVLDAFRTHAEKWGVDYFKIKPGSFAQQLAKTLKGVQGVLLLGYSPKYIIDNVINGEVTMAASGVYGLMTMKQIDTWTKRFGWTPERLHDSALFGDISGVPEGKKGGAIADAMRSKGVLGAVQKFTQGANKWSLMPLAGKFEGMQGARAQTVGMKQMWSKVWERGRGFSKMEAGLESSLRAIDPLLPELVYRAIESGINQKEVMDALAVRQAGVRTSDLVTGAAQKMGMTRSQALSLLETAGVMDALDGVLKGADTIEKVDAGFRSVMKRAEDWISIRKGQELRNKAEHVANALSAEGENRMWEVILDNVGYRNDQWVNHYLTADEVAATVEAIPDEFQGQKSLAWQDWYEKEQRAWGKTNGDVLTNLKGVMQALGLTHPDAQKLLSLMGEEFDSWGQAYDFRMKQYAEHYETWKGKFTQDTIETRMAELEKRGVLIDEEFKRAFATERVKEEQIRDLLVEMVRAKYGDAVADVTLRAYQQTVDFRAEMTGVLQKHRKDVKNLYGADRRAANRKFYQDDYLLRVVDMRRVWEDGIGEVQKATRGGTQKAEGGGQTPPTKPSPEPMAQVGLDTATITPTRPAVDLTPSPFPNGKGSDAVWKIASENGMEGVDRFGNQVFGAKLDVIKFVKKWGGSEGGHIKRFDDITPELMQKAVDAKAAWAKDQMALGLDIGSKNPTPTRPAAELKVESEALPEPSEAAVKGGEEAVAGLDTAGKPPAYSTTENPTYKKAINNHISELEPAAREALQYELSVMRDLVNQGEPGRRMFEGYGADRKVTAVPSTYPSWYGPMKRGKKDVLFALDALTRGLDKPENGLYRSLKGIAADLLSSDGHVLSEKWDWAKAWGYEGEVFWKLDRQVSEAVDNFYRAASEGDVRAMDIHRESLARTLGDYPKEALDSFVQVVNDDGKWVDGPESYRQYHERLWNEAEKLYQQGVTEKLNVDAELHIREAEARGEMAMTREVLREQLSETGLPDEQVDVLLEMYDANAKTYGPKYGLTPEEFYNRVYGGIVKGGLGELMQTTGIPKTGEQYAFRYVRNTNKAPRVGARFGQDIEPAGRYMMQVSEGQEVTGAEFQSGHITFKNPLVIDWGEGYQSGKNWKNVLSEQYGGKKGKALSSAIMNDGYDGIVTIEGGHTSEIVDLRGVETTRPKVRDILKQNRIEVVEYDSKVEGARQKAVEEAAARRDILFQENKGAVTMLDDMKGLIHAYEAADFSTFVHEPAHIFLRQLMNFDQALPEHKQAIAKDWKAVQDWVKMDGGRETGDGKVWEAVNGEGKHSIRESDGLFYYRGSSGEEYVFATFEEAQARMTDEMFARGFEKYIAEGSAPTKGLARVFEMAKEWMVGIYRAIIGGVIDVKITDEIRSVFDRLLTDEPLTRVSLDEKARVDALMKETGVDLFAGTKEMANNHIRQAQIDASIETADIGAWVEGQKLGTMDTSRLKEMARGANRVTYDAGDRVVKVDINDYGVTASGALAEAYWIQSAPESVKPYLPKVFEMGKTKGADGKTRYYVVEEKAKPLTSSRKAQITDDTYASIRDLQKAYEEVTAFLGDGDIVGADNWGVTPDGRYVMFDVVNWSDRAKARKKWDAQNFLDSYEPNRGNAIVEALAEQGLLQNDYAEIRSGSMSVDDVVKTLNEIRDISGKEWKAKIDAALGKVEEARTTDAGMAGVDLFAGTKEMAEGGRQKAEPKKPYDAGADAYNRLAEIGQTDMKALNDVRLSYRKSAREIMRGVAELTDETRIASETRRAGDFTAMEKAVERYIADLKAGTVKKAQTQQAGETLFQVAPPTRSEAFKRWFGESKVVDEKGNPLVVYHGTGADFTAFKPGEDGIFFTDDRVAASEYAVRISRTETKAANTLPVYLKLENPLVITKENARSVMEDVFGYKGKELDEAVSQFFYSDKKTRYWVADYAKGSGYDGIIIDGDVMDLPGKPTVKSYVAFEPTQIKSMNNRGTFEPTNPNILFQKAELPLGGMDQASGFIPEGAILDEAYASQLKPLLEAMRAEASLDTAGRSPAYSTTLGDLPVETQAALTAYLKKVTKREMPAAKLAAVRYGEGMRDFSMLNYNKKYGFDKAIEGIVPYQFWATRTGMNSALRIFDRPAWFANYFRLQRFASRYERDLPDRLKGKIRIELPFLPEWTGGALYVDPYKQLFPWTQYAQPFEQVRKDKNAQVFEAERVLQEWAADGKYSEAEITQAAGNQAGAVWEAALAEAAIRRKAEISSPLDLLSVMLGPAWYLSMPAKALGLEVPFINSKGEGPETISQLPMTKFGQGLETATAGTWAEPLGKLAGLLAKPEQWIREKNGLPQFGEYGEYYIDRQLANMVAEGVVSVEDAKRAMIERGGTAYDEAVERVRMELMLRTPSMSAVYAGTHGGLDDFLKAVPTSILGGGILPEGELRYRGLKEKWDAAWDAYDKGDTEAIGRFFDDHPEYEAYLARGQEPEERLRNMLVGQIWDSYMGLDKATRRVVTGQLGPLFEHSFLNSETRSPESLDVKTLARWSMMLGNDTPTPPQPSPSGAPDGEGAWPTDVPMLEGLPTGTRNALGEYEAAKAEQFANISELQNLYFESSDADRKRILSIYPQLKEYWDWRRQYIEEHPEAAPFLDKNVAKGIITGELDAWDYGMSQEQAERLIGYYNAEFDVPMYTADYYLKNATPFLTEALSAHQLMGTDLTEGAYKELQMIWEGFGKPGDSFDDWLENTIYATSGW